MKTQISVLLVLGVVAALFAGLQTSKVVHLKSELSLTETALAECRCNFDTCSANFRELESSTDSIVKLFWQSDSNFHAMRRLLLDRQDMALMSRQGKDYRIETVVNGIWAPDNLGNWSEGKRSSFSEDSAAIQRHQDSLGWKVGW